MTPANRTQPEGLRPPDDLLRWGRAYAGGATIVNAVIGLSVRYDLHPNRPWVPSATTAEDLMQEVDNMADTLNTAIVLGRDLVYHAVHGDDGYEEDE